MRHSLEYKHTTHRKTLGFIKLDTSHSHSLKLRILGRCSRHSAIIKGIHQEILRMLGKHFSLVESGHSHHKTNGLQHSRVLKNWKIDRDKGVSTK